MDESQFRSLSPMQQQNASQTAISNPFAQNAPSLPVSGTGHSAVTQEEVNVLLTLFRTGAFDRVVIEAQKLTERSPELTPLWDLQGAALRKLHQPLAALKCFENSLATGGETVSARFNLGATLHGLNRFAEAVIHLEKVLELAPGHQAATQALALCLNGMGRHLETVDLLSPLLKSGQTKGAILNTLGQALHHLNRLEDARACYQAVQAPPQQVAEAQSHLGTLAKAQGQSKQAKDHLNTALSLAPGLVTAHRNLSALTHYEVGHPHIRVMQDLLAQSDLGPNKQAELHFALFKAHHDCQDHDTAFAHLKAGNHLKYHDIGYALKDDETLFAHLRRIFNSPLPVAQSNLAFRPIFIVGLPRSGTTLAEQILCGCAGVTGGGELPYSTTAMVTLMQQLQRAGQQKPSTEKIQTLRDTLSRQMLPHGKGAPVLIDKMPLNLRWVGALLSAFPEAKIIHTTRPPADNCWGLYKVCFTGSGNGFAYDLQTISRYQQLADELMKHWNSLFPGKIHHLDHSQLTRCPETQARALVDFCGLKWSEDCLHPERQTGAVLTASAQQVRQPIYHKAVPDWTPYQSHLAELCHLFRD